MSRITGKEMIKRYLEENGYDGLFNGMGCGCLFDDFMPCSECACECFAGEIKRSSWYEDVYIGPKDDE